MFIGWKTRVILSFWERRNLPVQSGCAFFRVCCLGFRLGMFPLILTVLNREFKCGGTGRPARVTPGSQSPPREGLMRLSRRFGVSVGMFPPYASSP